MNSDSSIVGSIPDNWNVLIIGDLCDQTGGSVQTGPFGSQLHAEEYTIVGTPVVMPKNLGKNKIDNADIARISDEDVERLSRHQLEYGDIIFPRRGDISRYAHITEEYVGWLCGTGCLRIRLGVSLDTRFLAYYLGHPAVQGWIAGNAVGTTMLNLNTSIIRALPVSLPPLSEQRAIAHILGTLDDKIELNRRMNATLEAMARAIFKSWFVDFDPVHAKARGEQPSGMDADTAALFPDAFEQSELGLIPRGWEVESLAQHIKAIRGLSYKGSGLADNGMPMHNLNSVYEGGGYKYEGIKFYTGDYKERHILKPGDVIVTNTEQGFNLLLIGYAAIVPKWYGEKGIFSHHIYRVSPKPYSPLTSDFIYHLFVSPRFHRTIAGYSNGTTVNMLPPDALKKPLFVVPSLETIIAFENIVQPMREKAELNYDETVTLADLRDTLLPKLISGQLRVPEVEVWREDHL